MEQELWSRSCRALRQRLESLQRAGVGQCVRPPERLAAKQALRVPVETVAEAALLEKRQDAASTHAVGDVSGGSSAGGLGKRQDAASTHAVGSPAAGGSTGREAGVSQPVPLSRPAALDALRQEVACCLRCPALSASRTQTVFGVGDPQARLAFFGEAPGADEDRLGEPFVGAAGKLLDRILAACGLRRDEVYILNVLKCRPPDNRTPGPEEIANCRPFFERQLQILQPEFLCCLGATAAQALLRTTQPLGRLRGRFFDHQGSQVLVTYHPAYLLRSPDKKRETWEDMKMLLSAMGRPIPEPRQR